MRQAIQLRVHISEAAVNFLPGKRLSIVVAEVELEKEQAKNPELKQILQARDQQLSTCPACSAVKHARQDQ